MRANSADSGHWFFLVFGAIAIGVGSLAIAKPELSWRPNRWQFKNAQTLEPSRATLIFIRAIGVFFIAVAIVMIIIGIKQF